jgi:hypothetical protein
MTTRSASVLQFCRNVPAIPPALLSLLLLLVLPAHADSLRAGAAAVAIEAPAGVPLAGYGARGPGNRSAGGLAPVEARALLVEGAGGAPRVAIVALDALIVTPPLREAIAARAADLALDALVVAATHTHSGPGGYAEPLVAQLVILGWHDPAAAGALLAAADTALRRAAAALRPARLAAAVADGAGLAANRRPGGGASDPAVPALFVDAEDGAIATLFSLAAHPTVLSPLNDRLSPDYPGAARARVETRGGVALFLAGPLGDQKPHLAGEPEWPDDVTRQEETARLLGDALGRRVLAAAGAATGDPEPVLAVRRADWTLPPVDVRARCAYWLGAPILNLVARDFLPETTPLVALRLGPLRLFASPFELGVEVAAALRERAPGGGPLLVAAHANDWLGYLLQPADWDRGGYEPCLAYHGRALAPRFVDAAARLLETLP